MYRIALVIVTLTLVLSAQVTSPAANTQSVVSLNPSLTFEGGSPAERNTIIGAVDRYGAAGLRLPALKIRIHADRAGCNLKQGSFQVSNGEGVIDLCFDREFLALHELGHAWVHFNLEDRAREKFLRLTEALSWAGSETSWHRRGSEVAANTLAHGLLSNPLASSQRRTREFAQFQALTGKRSPRLTEVEPDHGLEARPSHLRPHAASAQQNSAGLGSYDVVWLRCRPWHCRLCGLHDELGRLPS